MDVKKAARRSHLLPETLRYYDKVGLVVPAYRADGQGEYTDADVRCLRFLYHVRRLGLSLDEYRTLLSLDVDVHRTEREIRAVAEHHLGALECKVRELKSSRDMLRQLGASREGDDLSDCPMLDALAGRGTPCPAPYESDRACEYGQGPDRVHERGSSRASTDLPDRARSTIGGAQGAGRGGCRHRRSCRHRGR